MARNPQKRAHGGKVFYAGKDSHVAHEAEEKKSGGKVGKFAHGGHVAHHKHGHSGPAAGFHKKAGGAVPGRAAGGRCDKRARGGKISKFARGGGVGSDKSPFSSAGHGYERCGPHSKSGV